jgi:hypothetical protein
MSAATCVSFCPSVSSRHGGSGSIVDVVVGPPPLEVESHGRMELIDDGMISAKR